MLPVLTSPVSISSSYPIHVNPNCVEHKAENSDVCIACSGDSYSACDFDVNGAQPSPTYPLGNAAIPELESKYGVTWPVYLTLMFNYSMIRTYDLAVWGAVVDKTLIPDSDSDFNDQGLMKFSAKYTQTDLSDWKRGSSLFGVWFGVNDVHRLVTGNVVGMGFMTKLKALLGAYEWNLDVVSVLPVYLGLLCITFYSFTPSAPAIFSSSICPLWIAPH